MKSGPEQTSLEEDSVGMRRQLLLHLLSFPQFFPPLLPPLLSISHSSHHSFMCSLIFLYLSTLHPCFFPSYTPSLSVHPPLLPSILSRDEEEGEDSPSSLTIEMLMRKKRRLLLFFPISCLLPVGGVRIEG